MATTHHSVSDQLQKTLNDAKQLADEIRLEIHLGTMELKDRWAELEPQVWKVEQASREAAIELVARLRKLREALAAKKKV